MRAHSPHDVIDAFAISPNYAVDGTIFCASDGSINVFLVSRDRGLTWTQARNGMRGVRMHAIRFASDWATSGEIFVLTNAGVQVSTDRGNTWLQTNILRGGMRRMAVSPVQSTTRSISLFYASNNQLWRSDDRGLNDSILSLPLMGATIESVAVSPTYWTDSTVAVTTSDNRLLVSTDGGSNWSPTLLAATGKHVSFSGDFANDQKMWVSTWGAGVVGSQDGGATFGATGTGLTDLFINETSVVDPLTPGPNPSMIYAGTQAGGVFQSADGGATWTRTGLNILLSHQSTNHFTHMQASPTWHTDSTVMCGTFEGLYFSSDGGTTWTDASINQTRAGRLVSVSPTYAIDQTVFGAGYGMPPATSRNGGGIWTYGWEGVISNSVYSLGPSPEFATDNMLLAAGGSVIGRGATMYRSLDGGRTFSLQFLPPHPQQCDPFGNQSGYEIKSITYSPDFANDRTVFALSHMGVVYKSTDAGASWNLMALMSSTRCWHKMVVPTPDYANTNEVFVAGAGLYRSTDGGATFNQTHPGVFWRITIPADYATTGELYGFDYDGQFYVVGLNGTVAVRSTAGMDGYRMTAIHASPNIANDNTLIAGTAGGGIFESTDRGRTWQRASVPGSVIDHVFSLQLSPDFGNDGTMFAGTYNGHARSTDGGRNWKLVTEYEVYDDGRDPWMYFGNWQEIYDPEAIKIEVHQSTQVGATMQLAFVGHRVRLFGAVGPDHGILEVRLNGQSIATVDSYRAVSSPHEFFLDHRIPFGRHVLEVVVTGQRNPASTGTAIAIDAAEVYYNLEGSYSEIGAGCVGSTGLVPRNDVIGSGPTYGQSLQVEIRNATASQALSALLIGAETTGGLDLGAVGAPGCVLYPQTLAAMLAPTNASGVGSLTLPVPNDPALLGGVFYTQPVIADLGHNDLGIVVGSAKRGYIGAP